MIPDFFSDPSVNSWWKRKLDSLGYKFKPLNLYDTEGECPLCAKGNYLWPLGGTFNCCEFCFKRFANYNFVKYKLQVATSLYGQQCNLCSRKTFRYIHIIDGKFCSKCFWAKLGKRKGRLKDDGGSRV